MNTKSKTIAVLMAAIIVSAAVVPMVIAASIPTEGVVTGSTTPPIIKAKWELPDDADAPLHLTPGTQVLPEANANKLVKMYMVARDPNGAGDIVNAGFRIEHPAAPDPDTACWMPTSPVPAIYGYGMVDQLAATEWFYGTVITPGPQRAAIEAAIAAAVNVNLINQTVANDLLEELEQQEARFFYAEESFTCCWAPGNYSVMAWASDNAGGQGELVNNLTYESIIAIDLDFSAGINYGDLVPGVKQILSGDEVFSAGDGAPTVISLANDPIEIWLHATPLEGEMKQHLITNFDARLNHDVSVDFVAGQNTLVPGVLIPNWLEKMDFSVTPPDNTPADTYRGTMTLWIKHYYC